MLVVSASIQSFMHTEKKEFPILSSFLDFILAKFMSYFKIVEQFSALVPFSGHKGDI